MRFKLLSDLHLEFDRGDLWKPTPTAEDNITTLLLAGDIHIGRKAEAWIDEMCDRYHKVIYILGNHEYYDNEYYGVQDFWRNKDQTGNFVFLENSHTYLKGNVAVFGATMWTYVHNSYAWDAKRMNDYRIIKINDYGNIRTLRISDTNIIHDVTIEKLTKFLAMPMPDGGRKIVMTHHLPHLDCVNPKYYGSDMNKFFVTNLDDIIKENDIAYWVHGHTHDNVNTVVHGTHILCNPRGYHGYELNKNFDEDLIFYV